MRLLALAAIPWMLACVSASPRRSTEPPSVEMAQRSGSRTGPVGVLERREVDLTAVRVQLGRGSRCRRADLDSAAGEDGVLEGAEASRAGCRVSVYRGPFGVAAIRPDGSRRERIIMLKPDADGWVRVEYGQVDAILRGTGGGSLDDYQSLELGRGGWAGTVNLRRLRAFLSDWHYAWVSRGRGSIGLFVVRYPDHPARAEAEAMALQGRVARQERDYEAVREGTMDPADFLERHVWSPFRRAVEALAAHRHPWSDPSESAAPASEIPQDGPVASGH